MQAIDFSVMKNGHRKWFLDLKDYIEGKMEESELGDYLVDHTQCPLGQWYYGSGMKEYGHLQDMKDLEGHHENFHKLVHNAIKLQSSGQVVAAKEEYQKLFMVSTKVLNLIADIEKQTNQ